jgi:signal transduction histidine kinase
MSFTLENSTIGVPRLKDLHSLAGFLPCAVMLLDEAGGLLFASSAACELLNARDETELRSHWRETSERLGIGDPATLSSTSEQRFERPDVDTNGNRRHLHLESHALASGDETRHLVLLRDRRHLAASEDALVSASRGFANLHVLSGVLHELGGPLNNFNLMLALFDSAIGKLAVAAPSETVSRCRHYLDVLQKESGRMAFWVSELRKLTSPPHPVEGAIDLCEISRDVLKLLRHDARLNEVEIDLALPTVSVFATGDAELVRLALLNFTQCMVHATPAGGRVEVAVKARAGDACTIRIASPLGRLPDEVTKAFDRVLNFPAAPYVGLHAGRMIAETQRGGASLAGSDDGPSIELSLPAKAA